MAGAGLIGARHVALCRDHPGVTLAGVIDPDPDRRDAFGVPGFAGMDQVDIEADGIILATPTHLHADHAEQAAARGWPMLIEKPVGDTPEQARRIIAATEGRVPTLIGHHRRHHPRLRQLAGMLKAGEIGAPVTVSLIWAMKKPDPYFDVSWRQGRAGSPLLINLVHDVDLLRHLFGEITHVSGHGRVGQGRVQSGAIALGFDCGLSASLTFADTTPSPWGFEAGTGENPNIGATHQDMMWITGTSGAISFPSLTLWGGAADWSSPVTASQPTLATGSALVAQLDHFCDVIAGRAAPMIDARDGAATLEAVLRIETALSGAQV